MNRTLTLLLGAVVLVSTSANLFLFTEVQKWRKAWAGQFLATSDIEGILKASGADISMAGIKRAAESRPGVNSVQVVEVGEIHTQSGLDRRGLKINGTLILFKDGIFQGSKAALP
jgi:hypothetical protein